MKLKLSSTKDLRSKKPAELEKYITELRSNQAELLHAIATGKDKQTHQLGRIRRSIATAKTLAAQNNSQTKEGKE